MKFILVVCVLGVTAAILLSFSGSNALAYYDSYSFGYFMHQSPPPLLSLSLDPQASLNTAFRIAAREDRLKDMFILLNEGAEVDSRSDRGRTALMLASRNCSTEIVKALLGLHADVNVKDKFGRTALMYAAIDSCLPVVKLLLKRPDIDMRCTDKSGATAVIYAGASYQISDAIRQADHRSKKLKQRAGYSRAG